MEKQNAGGAAQSGGSSQQSSAGQHGSLGPQGGSSERGNKDADKKNLQSSREDDTDDKAARGTGSERSGSDKVNDPSRTGESGRKSDEVNRGAPSR